MSNLLNLTHTTLLVFYGELQTILAEKRQRKPIKAWAAAKFREKFEHHPPQHWGRVEAVEPSSATRAWVRSRDIAYKAMHTRR